MIREHTFSAYTSASLKQQASHVFRNGRNSSINPNGYPTQQNVYVRSINQTAWWARHSPTQQRLHNIFTRIISPLPSSVKNQISASRILIRHVPNISANYIAQQTLHVNVTRNPVEGEAFMQILYYVDTPQIGGVNAPNNERGQLLLYKRGNAPRIFTPKKGTAIYFPPNETFHEVVAPRGNVPGNVNRTMIIIILYRKTHLTGNVNVQVRPFGPVVAHAMRTVAGHEAPSRSTGGNISGLENIMSRARISSPRRFTFAPGVSVATHRRKTPGTRRKRKPIIVKKKKFSVSFMKPFKRRRLR